MNIQEAVKVARTGLAIRRAVWSPYEASLGGLPVDHRKKHLLLVESDIGLIPPVRCFSDNREFPDSMPYYYHFTEEDLLAEDWESIPNKCTCVECDPSTPQHAAPLQVGDIIEYYPCSGFRVVWKITSIANDRVNGQVTHLFDNTEPLTFSVEGDYSRIRIHEQTVYRSWAPHHDIFEEVSRINLGLIHRWPCIGSLWDKNGKYGKLHCRLVGKNLEWFLELTRKHGL